MGLFLVTRPVNVRYLTGFSGDSTALLCLPGQDLLVSDGRYSEQLARECPDLEVFIRPPSVTLPMALGEVLRSTGEIAGMGLMGLGGLIAVIGGLLIGLIETFWSAYFSTDYKDVAAFSILIVALIFLPTGILGRPEVEKV